MAEATLRHHWNMPDLRVDLPGPLDLAASLEPFRRSGDDLLDRWDGRRLLRTMRIDGRTIAFRATIEGSVEAPALSVRVEPAADPARPAPGDPEVAEAIRRAFVPAPSSWPALIAVDRVLADLDQRHPGLRPVLQPDLFTGLVRSISAQQVNLAWAATTRRRLAEAHGERHEIDGDVVYRLSPERIAAIPPEALRALQFTTAQGTLDRRGRRRRRGRPTWTPPCSRTRRTTT